MKSPCLDGADVTKVTDGTPIRNLASATESEITSWGLSRGPSGWAILTRRVSSSNLPRDLTRGINPMYDVAETGRKRVGYSS
jgi:hypothetical protein